MTPLEGGMVHSLVGYEPTFIVARAVLIDTSRGVETPVRHPTGILGYAFWPEYTPRYPKNTLSGLRADIYRSFRNVN